MNRENTGILLVLVSAVSFGFTPIFARLAYSEGIKVNELLFFRFFIAFLITGIILAARGRLSLPAWKDLLVLITLGALGYFLETTLYFTSLLYSPVAIVALLLYTYPVFVAVGAFFLRWERLSRTLAAAILIALIGLVLVANSFNNSLGRGVMLALGASVMYTLYILGGSRVLKRVGGDLAAFYVMGAASLSFGLTGEGSGSFRLDWGFLGWVWVVLIALICTVVAVITFLIGVSRIGPSKSALLSLVEPVTSVLVALALFGNALTALQWFGGLLILSAAVATTLCGRLDKERSVVRVKSL